MIKGSIHQWNIKILNFPCINSSRPKIKQKTDRTIKSTTMDVYLIGRFDITNNE